MARTNNRRSNKLALENGWYSRWDEAAGGAVSCGKDEPGARLDIIRAIEALADGKDRGPSTAETIREMNAREPRWTPHSTP